MKLPWNRRRERDWQDEIDAHLAMREECNRQAGMEPGAARQFARRQFGNLLHTYEDIRGMHVRRWLDDFLRDVRIAFRSFRRSPALAGIAIVTIAVGIGASTSIFGVVDPLLFRSLPYPNDRQLVSIGYFGPVDSNEFNVVASYLDWRARQTAFQSMTSMRAGSQCDLLAGDTPDRIDCQAVEANWLRTFGLKPALGRDFTPEDDQPHASPVALISYGFWQHRFGGDAGALGTTVTIDGRTVRIVGVLPKDFEMPQLGPADVLMPGQLNPALPRAANAGSFLRTFARLRDGVTIGQARAQMQPLFDRTAKLDVPPELRKEVRLVIRSLRERQIHDVKAASWMLLGAVMALLLLVCSNVANLLLARATARRREIAVSLAIGAGRGRLVRQMFTESLVLAAAGGLAGSGLAWALLRTFVALAPEGLLRRSTGFDLRTFLFALVTSLGTALLFGVAPALERPRTESLAGSHVVSPTSRLLSRVLVSAQVAISLVLLTSASLFARSFWKLEQQPLGYQPAHLIAASFTLPRMQQRTPGAQAALFRQVEDRLKSIPGGGLAALSDSIPPRGSMGRPYSNIRIAGHPPVASDGGMVEFRWVTPGYFPTMEIPIVAGRPFEDSDRGSGPSPLILSEALARRLFGLENPIGRQLSLDGDGRWCSVVGVAADTRNNGLTETDPEYYRLRMDNSNLPRTAVALFRASLDPALLARWIRVEIATVDPRLPVKIETMETHVAAFRRQPRFLAWLVASFAAFGLLLAAVGLYGVLSFHVARQTQEIGVRMALGATPRDIALQVQRQAGLWTALGAIVGFAGSLAVARTLKGLLFGVTPYDPVSLAASVLLLGATAVIAAWLPSHRASSVDPMVALRYE